MGIGKNIKRYRHRVHMTQDQLASELGVARATIAQWEAESSTPKAERISDIAKALCVPADYILGPVRISYLLGEPGVTDEDLAFEAGLIPEPTEPVPVTPAPAEPVRIPTPPTEPTPAPLAMTGPELKLLGIYRSLTGDGQRMLLTFAEDLDSSGAYRIGGRHA